MNRIERAKGGRVIDLDEDAERTSGSVEAVELTFEDAFAHRRRRAARAVDAERSRAALGPR
jgi:hypothetical protein